MQPITNAGLTGIRGIAALAVAAYHMRRPLNEIWFNDVAWVGRAYRVLQHGYLGVDLFFVLSGFVLAMSYAASFQAGMSRAGLAGFMVRRVFRIYPLYAVTLAVAALAAWCLPGLNLVEPGRSLAVAIGSNILLAQTWLGIASLNAPAWSLSVEWGAYLLFPAIVAAVFARVAWRAAILPVLALAGLLALGLAPPDIVVWRSGPFDLSASGDALLDWVVSPLRGIAGFVLGVWAFRVAGHPGVRRFGRSSAGFALVAGVILALLPGFRTDVAIVLLFPPLIWCLHHRARLADRLLGNRAVHWLGNVSYSVYLLQMPFVISYHQLVAQFAIPFGAADMLLWAAHMAALLGLSHLSWRWIERPGVAAGRALQGRMAGWSISRQASAPRRG